MTKTNKKAITIVIYHNLIREQIIEMLGEKSF